MPRTLLELATDPRQYDELKDWGEDRSSHEAFFARQILKFRPYWSGKSVLEVGSGTGWLMDFLLRNGAHHVIGIEPSDRQISVAKNRYPELTVHHSSFEDYADPTGYDLVVSHMSIMHIPDLSSFFDKTNGLLSENGHVLLTVPDPAYFTSSKRGPLEHERIEPDVEVIHRPGGTTDVIRSLEKFRSAALSCGLSSILESPVCPDQGYTKLHERYASLNGSPIAHSFLFRR
jgi:SAM-dependent methyltransferase